jgi:hypothetical protein
MINNINKEYQKLRIMRIGDIFLKNLFLKCFWWALRNKEFDFFNFLKGGNMVFSPLRSENAFYI